MPWLRRSFVTGFFVTVPLFISVAAVIWIFNIVDGLTTPLYDRVLGQRIPGLGTASTALVIVVVGAVARNVIGRRVLSVGERVLLRVPVFRQIYGPVKQLIAAFSPDKPAIHFEGATLSYAAFNARIEATARALNQAGFRVSVAAVLKAALVNAAAVVFVQYCPSKPTPWPTDWAPT